MAKDYDVGLRFRSDSTQIKRSDKDLEKLEKQTKRSEKAAASLGRTMGRAFAGVSFGLVFRQVIRNTVAQEKAQVQLGASLRSTGRYSKELQQALTQQAAALQGVTTYGDEAILGANNLLLTFRRIGSEAFPRALESTLDLATVMGTDLKSAALQLGKALEDPATQMTYLSRAGITFTQQQKDQVRVMQKAGDLAGAQALVLSELETQFGGSARAARDSFGGALEAVQNKLGDLLEGKGGTLTGATQALNDLEETLNDPQIEQGFQNLITGFFRTVEWSAKAGAGFANFGQAVGEFFARFNFGDLPESVEDIDTAISRLKKELETGGTSGSAVERVLNLFSSEVSAERRAEIQREIVKLQALRELYADEAFFSDKKPEPPKLDFSGLDATVNTTPVIDTAAQDKLRDYVRDTLAKVYEDGSAAAQSLDKTLKDLAGTMGDEATQASLQLSEKMAELEQQELALGAAGFLTKERQEQLTNARALAVEQYERELAAIEAQKSPAEELLERLRLEGELIGLTNVEREKRIALQLAGTEATAEEIAAIEAQVEANNKAKESEAAWADFRDNATDALTAVVTGSKSASDAFKSFADQVINDIARILIQKALLAIFGGGPGGAGAGGAGTGAGMFGTIMGSIFGPGRALGGPIYPGRLHPVTETGAPEMLETMDGKNYLLTGNTGGRVRPVQTTNVTQGNVHLEVNLPAQERRKSAESLAAAIYQETKRAGMRNN